MKDIYLGKNIKGESIYLNLEKEGIRFILLVGDSGSGKSIFHNNLYKELSEKHSPEEVGFIFMDMTQVDFTLWNSNYLIMSTIKRAEDALNILEGLKDEKRTIIVHIEEANMVYMDRKNFEKGLDNIIYNNKNIIIVFSTSRANPEYLNSWMDKYINCKVIFKCFENGVSENILGNDMAFNLKQPGERILAYNNKQIKCLPFSENESKELKEFKL